MRQVRSLAGALLGAGLAACQPGTPLTSIDPAVEAEARAACQTTPYRNCVEDAVDTIRSVPPHTLVVICDLGDGNGSVATLLRVDDADDACSKGGTRVPSKVVAVIAVP